MDDVRRIPVPNLHKQIQGMEKFLEMTGLNVVLEMGGLIAGGFPRYCMKTGQVDPAYFSRAENFTKYTRSRVYEEVGDVDIFFRTPEDCETAHKIFLQEMKANRKDKDIWVSDHISCFAHNIFIDDMAAIDLKITGSVNRKKFSRVKVQFINCTFGEPEEILGNFDIRNCMIGFDNSSVYSFVNRSKLEHSRQIGLNPTKYLGVTLARRLAKYFHKYGYESISSDSVQTLERLCLQLVCSDLNRTIEEDLPTKNNLRMGVFNPYTVRREVLARKLMTILPEHLLKMFVNRMFDYRYDSYTGLSQQVDVAATELNARLKFNKEK